jgi:hypothetical protein
MSARLEVLALADKHKGKFTPAMLVAAARKPTSALHRRFEWDDTIAGQKYRLYQARLIINVVVMPSIAGKTTVAIPVFVRNPEMAYNVQGYVAVEQLAANPESAMESVNAEFSRVLQALTRARHLAVALGFARDIDRLMEDVRKLAGRIPSPPKRKAA